MELAPLRKERLAWRMIDQNAVVIQTKKAEVHEFNEVGTFLWNLADGSRSVSSIVMELSKTYEVSSEQAVQDVQEFFNDLEQKELIEWTS